jgi:hypothetical protein
MRLDAYIAATAKRVLADVEHELTVASVRESVRLCVGICVAVFPFSLRPASLSIIVRNLLGSGPLTA